MGWRSRPMRTVSRQAALTSSGKSMLGFVYQFENGCGCIVWMIGRQCPTNIAQCVIIPPLFQFQAKQGIAQDPGELAGARRASHAGALHGFPLPGGAAGFCGVGHLRLLVRGAGSRRRGMREGGGAIDRCSDNRFVSTAVQNFDYIPTRVTIHASSNHETNAGCMRGSGTSRSNGQSAPSRSPTAWARRLCLSTAPLEQSSRGAASSRIPTAGTCCAASATPGRPGSST